LNEPHPPLTAEHLASYTSGWKATSATDYCSMGCMDGFCHVRLIALRKPDRRKNSALGDAPEPFAWYRLYGSDAETKERSLEEKTLDLAGDGDDVELYGRRDRSGIGLAPGK
jgi:hypothetical protein